HAGDALQRLVAVVAELLAPRDQIAHEMQRALRIGALVGDVALRAAERQPRLAPLLARARPREGRALGVARRVTDVRDAIGGNLAVLERDLVALEEDRVARERQQQEERRARTSLVAVGPA